MQAQAMIPARALALVIGAFVLLGFAGCSGAGATESAPEEKRPRAAATNDEVAEAMAMNATNKATLGGGCFWCIEAVFERVRGVETVVSGYAGGDVKNPGYREVTSGATGHAEVVQLSFDPEQISYRAILEIFFAMHDPTTLNRQGADVGTQYRSIVLAHDDEQLETAKEVVEELEREGVYADPIVTEIERLEGFYPAEDYHQDYYENNAAQPYCQVVIAPKVNKLRAKHADKLKDVYR
jgi:peptide-methionine (S)-S-oxide reductase